jgi:hypothetical protein
VVRPVHLSGSVSSDDYCAPSSKQLHGGASPQTAQGRSTLLPSRGGAAPASAMGPFLGLRAAPKEDLGVSSAELAYGAPLTLPGQFITAEEPPPAAFVERSGPHLRCRRPGRLLMRKWLPSRRPHWWQQSSCLSAEAGPFCPWSCSTWVHTGYCITGPGCFALP